MKIGIIGAGKVGTALGHAFRAKGLELVAISDQEEAPLKAARQYLGDNCLYVRENEEVVRLCDVIAVTTQDREIKGVARKIAGSNRDLGARYSFTRAAPIPPKNLRH